MSLELWIQCLQGVGSMMILLWLWSLVKRDVSVVDPWWSFGFLIVAWFSFRSQPVTFSKCLQMFLISLWAIRLWLYLLHRSRGKTEDPRYTALREKYGRERYWWFSLFQVFGLQGLLILLISTPLQVALTHSPPDPLVATDGIGCLLVSIGILIESLADWQMLRFKSNPENRGRVMDRGVWRYSRHPNYFGECLLWWGFWLFALDSAAGVWTLYAPMLMTYLLLKVSGVTLLEQQLSSSKPGYAEYVARTSAFIPWPPKQG